MPAYHARALAAALQRLGRSAHLPAAAAHLREHASSIGAELRATVLAEIPAFTASRDPLTLRALDAHAPQHLVEILRLLEGGDVGDFAFVREHARRRAEHRFPLEAVLHAYRCGHKVFARWLRQAVMGAPKPVASRQADRGGMSKVAAPHLLMDTVAPPKAAGETAAAVADFALEYTDAVSTVLSAAYASQVQLLADVAGDERAQLLNIVLGGFDESDARVAAILRRAGFLQGRQSFCVVLAQAVQASEMDSPARTRRLAETLDQLVPAQRARRLIDVRDGRVTAVFSGVQRQSGWTPASPSLAERIAADLATAGNGVLVGVSGDVFSTSRVPSAHRQALLALRMASLTTRVVAFAATPLRHLMIHLAGDDLQRLLPTWAADFYAADDKLGGSLQATLRAYAGADMNLLKAAAQLGVHPNTLYARMNRISEVTGLNARGYAALTDLLTVLDARDAGTNGV